MLSYKRWSPDSMIRLLVKLFLTLGLVGLAGSAAEAYWSGVPEEARRFWVSFACGGAMQVAGLGLFALYLRENAMTWREAFGLRWERAGWMVVLGLLTAAGALVLSLGLIRVSQSLIEAVHLTPKAQTSIEALRQTDDLWRRSAVALTAIGLAPIFEEVLFRGLMYPAIKQAGFPRAAAWTTAVLFAASHVNLLTFLPLVVFSLILTALYERTDNLLAPIIAHAAFNAANYSLVLLSRPPL